MHCVNQTIWKLLRALRLDAPVDLLLPQRQSMLYAKGWFESYHTKQAVNREGL